MKKDKEEALLKKREEAERKVRIVNSHQPCHYLRGVCLNLFLLFVNVSCWNFGVFLWNEALSFVPQKCIWFLDVKFRMFSMFTL